MRTAGPGFAQRRRLGRALVLLCASAATAGACSGNSNDNGASGPDGASAGQAGSGEGVRRPGEAGSGFELSVAGADSAQGGANSQPELTLQISADQDEVEASGEPVSVALTARYSDGSEPNHLVWSVDNPQIASVSDAGELRVSGFVAGDVVVTAQAGDQTA